MGGPGEEVVCMSCVVSWLPGEPEPWLLNAFTGCRRAKGDGAAGERNLPGEGTAEWQRKINVFSGNQVQVKLLLYDWAPVHLYSCVDMGVKVSMVRSFTWVKGRWVPTNSGLSL